MSAETPNDAKQWVEERVRRAVAASALRQIRGLVDEHEKQDRFERRFSRVVLGSLGAVILVLVVAVVIFGLAPIIRSLTGATGAVPRTPVTNATEPRSPPAQRTFEEQGTVQK